MSEGPAHVVVLAASGCNEFLEARHYHVVAAAAVRSLAKPVMNLFASVQAQNHIMHLFVREVDNVVIYSHAVSCQGEAEVFIMRLFYRTAVTYDSLDYVPVHKGLATEEIHLQIHSVAGIFYEEVQGPLAGLQTHESPLAMEFSLAGEAVFAAEIAGVSHMKAQGLYIRVTVFQVESPGLVSVLFKEFPVCLQLIHIVEDLIHICHRHGIFLHDRICDLLPAQVPLIKKLDDVISNIIHAMYGTTVHIQHYVITI